MLFIVQWIRSLIFALQMYLAMTVIAFFGAPISFLRTDYAYLVVRFFCNYVTSFTGVPDSTDSISIVSALMWFVVSTRFGFSSVSFNN